jgi:hypothetical protein
LMTGIHHCISCLNDYFLMTDNSQKTHPHR